MIFNTLVFLQFAVAFFLLWPAIRPNPKIRYGFLILASCLFYGYGGWWFVPLLLATASFDFWIGQRIYDDPDRKKLYLYLSLISNLGVLGLFKYAAFFAESVNFLFGGREIVPVVRLILPIGISFYTFQSLSYIFDIYKGSLKPAKSIWHFLSIVTLFPHLVAGPIVRVAHILPQIEICPKPTKTQMWDGAHLIVRGLFRKMVLADNLAPYVDTIYGGGSHSGAQYFLGSLAFCFQVYFDFSGYTDTARGLAKWIGLEFSLNFNHPLSSIGIRDFWTRWHISLSHWIRDYIYIPLGGSKKGEWAAHRNSWIAMLASGLWHGANWTYIGWGALNALFISIERITNWPEKISKTAIGKVVGVGITMLLFLSGLVLFRSTSLFQAGDIFAAMLTPKAGYLAGIGDMDIKVKFAFALSLILEGGYTIQRHFTGPLPQPWYAKSLASAAMIFLCVYLPGPGQAFVYFQF